MVYKIIYLISTIIFITSCTSLTQDERNKRDLINAVKKCIDSGELPGRAIGVYKSNHDYGNYELYTIGEFYGIIYDDSYPNEILKQGDKYIIICSNTDTGIAEEEVDRIVEESKDFPNNNNLFYFAQCKSTGKSLLVKAINHSVESYEIPEIRDFTCNDDILLKNDIEIIVTKYSFKALEKYILNNDTINHFPIKYKALFTVYNRSDSCLFFGTDNDLFGHFAIINGKDTLHLEAKPTLLNDYITDDPNHEEYMERYIRFSVESKIDPKFFSNIYTTNYHQTLTQLLRDSIFYFPNDYYYKNYVNQKNIYPKKRIKVITPTEIAYTYSTPQYNYIYVNNSIIYKNKIFN